MFVERKITALTKAMCQIFPIRICSSRIWVRLFCFSESISSTLQQQLPAWYLTKRESYLDVNFPVILTSKIFIKYQDFMILWVYTMKKIYFIHTVILFQKLNCVFMQEYDTCNHLFKIPTFFYTKSNFSYYE